MRFTDLRWLIPGQGCPVSRNSIVCCCVGCISKAFCKLKSLPWLVADSFCLFSRLLHPNAPQKEDALIARGKCRAHSPYMCTCRFCVTPVIFTVNLACIYRLYAYSFLQAWYSLTDQSSFKSLYFSQMGWYVCLPYPWFLFFDSVSWSKYSTSPTNEYFPCKEI